ncbi:potassium-transporting ATPase subunit KdpC [Lactiplantibacillus plantarum]|jgi:K+-transporting ATPase ATPase C chain|uniref:potassium-transporting ATPase subunit KdpC n=1 Tax=Lactiplantibacillus plantarum TaxID=1590 RepID=UPI0011D9679E|nr:potassium-transporting ATPase subunit KdpC [Lactiplantibacillus plantarum]MBJ7523350.1 potassium-transporting ATPase subunit KdpC [Lactobacillus sp. CRM56-2]TYA17212.1 potassium-transporting ATPase subunit KdpC [Lactobacillus sp. LSI2-1]MCW6146385.1 potassium-transporting ATPase subunit KdpC [Lactiplantibacillus plantarum]MDB7773159.1 potassium-transporting ATPase subunit KdpC [Lactiplantibacillus plantarum]MDI5787446.1 potassium-transporting ATPase subunit KdpC [Lactiplantibacillus plantar
MVVKTLGKSILAVIVITIICGIYTLIVSAIGQTFFTSQANGSLVRSDQTVRGSALIAQPFTSKKYLWGRQMDITVGDITGQKNNKNIMYSVASQMSPNDKSYQKEIIDKEKTIKRLNPNATYRHVPIDLVTNSGSGLDPEISPTAAKYQVNRIAKARHVSVQKIQRVIDQNTKTRTLGILGEPRVNVLETNLALDKLSK